MQISGVGKSAILSVQIKFLIMQCMQVIKMFMDHCHFKSH